MRINDKIDDDILSIINIFESINSDPKIELFYVNNLTLLIAIALSAQTTDKMVNRVTKVLFEDCKTIDDFLELGEYKLSEYIKVVGFYKTKAKNVINLCKILKDRYLYLIPSNFEDLIKLPGVGRKTANVYLGIVQNASVIGVDRHVHRVANRVGIVDSKDVNQTEKILNEKIPAEKLNKMHHWLVLHGRYICTARNPKCTICPIKNFCKSYGKFD